MRSSVVSGYMGRVDRVLYSEGIIYDNVIGCESVESGCNFNPSQPP